MPCQDQDCFSIPGRSGGPGELDPSGMLKLGALSLQSGVWASLLQLSALVLLKSLTKLPGVSEDAQISSLQGWEMSK